MKNIKTHWKNYFIVLLLIVLVLNFNSNTFMGSMMKSSSSMAMDSYMESSYIRSDIAPYYGNGDDLGSNERKIIKNANLNIESKEYEATKVLIASTVNNYDAVILSEQSSAMSSRDIMYSNYRIKVDSTKLDSFVDELKLLGKVTSVNIYSNDITGTYTDYSKRLERYEEQIAKYVVMLEKDLTVEEEVQVHSRIDQIEEQIAYTKRQIGNFDEDISYSEVYLTVQEVPTLLEEINFQEGKDYAKVFITTIQEALNLVLKILAYAIPFGIIYLIYRFSRKYFK